MIKSDAQAEKDYDLIAIDRVGMTEIETALKLFLFDSEIVVPARLDVFVNLQSGHRGIHMSRLYELVQKKINLKNVFEMEWPEILSDVVSSQVRLSSQAQINIQFQLPLFRRALISNAEGLRNYPCELQLFVDQQRDTSDFLFQTQFDVIYSSTCPQSLLLSEEYARQNQFKTNCSHLQATPHAQRSRMSLKLQNFQSQILNPVIFIELIEALLKTPVQTYVKKADEMEFARLNAENPMFCEDAVRKVALGLNQRANALGVSAFEVKTSHEESLHPHNATSLIRSSNFKLK